MKERFTWAYLAAGGVEAEVSASQREQQTRGQQTCPLGVAHPARLDSPSPV